MKPGSQFRAVKSVECISMNQGKVDTLVGDVYTVVATIGRYVRMSHADMPIDVYMHEACFTGPVQVLIPIGS